MFQQNHKRKFFWNDTKICLALQLTTYHYSGQKSSGNITDFFDRLSDIQISSLHSLHLFQQENKPLQDIAFCQ